MGTQDSQYSVDSYAQAMSGYSSSGTPSGYTSTTGYIPGTNYQASQIQGYPPTSAYPSMPGFPAGSSYSTGANYPPVSGYPTSTGYTAPGFPATVGRQGNMNDPPNYIYDTSGDYTNPSYQYRQQGTYPSAYPSDSRPVNVSESRIGPPRASTGYGYVSSPQESGGRSAANFTYDPAVSGQGRGGFPAPPRGAPTGYDGQPLDGGRRPEYRR